MLVFQWFWRGFLKFPPLGRGDVIPKVVFPMGFNGFLRFDRIVIVKFPLPPRRRAPPPSPPGPRIGERLIHLWVILKRGLVGGILGGRGIIRYGNHKVGE